MKYHDSVTIEDMSKINTRIEEIEVRAGNMDGNVIGLFGPVNKHVEIILEALDLVRSTLEKGCSFSYAWNLLNAIDEYELVINKG